MPKALVFAPRYNTDGKRDATGAFQPEAHAFCRALSLPNKVHLFDNGALRAFGSRRVDCEAAFASAQNLGIVAFFMHGWKDGVQAGWRKGDVHKLARTLFDHCDTRPVVLLYACDAGRDDDQDRDDDVAPGPGGEGGFADMLRDECRKLGLQATIYAHTTEGHCTQNPNVRVFLPDEMAGGRWVIDPSSNLWPAWKRAMRSTDLRFRFAFLPRADLEAELRGAGPTR